MPPLVCLFFVAVAEPSGRAITRKVAHEILAALTDPLSLFSQRSPGQRIAGRLLSTKGKGGPQERVLSTVRDRQPPPPVADNPVPDSVATIPIIPPQYEVPPTDQTLGALPFVPPAPFIPPGFIPGGFPTPNPPPIMTPGGPPPEGPGGPPPGGPPPGGPPPGGPPPGGPPPGGPPPGGPPPGGPPPGGPPPGGPPPGGPPPEGPPPGGPDTPPIPIPEPSTWTLMLLGFAVVAVGRRRLRRPQTEAGG